MGMVVGNMIPLFSLLLLFSLLSSTSSSSRLYLYVTASKDERTSCHIFEQTSYREGPCEAERLCFSGLSEVFATQVPPCSFFLLLSCLLLPLDTAVHVSGSRMSSKSFGNWSASVCCAKYAPLSSSVICFEEIPRMSRLLFSSYRSNKNIRIPPARLERQSCRGNIKDPSTSRRRANECKNVE